LDSCQPLLSHYCTDAQNLIFKVSNWVYNMEVQEEIALERVLGARIKSLREYRGWDVGQLAYKSHISAGYIYKLESNARPNVAGIILAQLAKATISKS